jgi:nitrite reductase/ring-hydroxylating ferredoxin subunit
VLNLAIEGVMTVICGFDQVKEGGAKGFSIDTNSGHESLILTKRHGQFYAYLNVCPHLGVNLDWIEDQFLSEDGQYLQCATHTAWFRFEDGVCVAGPCAGDALTSCPIAVRDGFVVREGA